jgi:hypothetical protein
MGPPCYSHGRGVGVELAFWDSIKDSGSVAELDAYLTRYPDGPFNVLALTRRDALIADDESVVPTKEDTLAVELAFWEAAKDSGSPVELEAYLERFAGLIVDLIIKDRHPCQRLFVFTRSADQRF